MQRTFDILPPALQLFAGDGAAAGNTGEAAAAAVPQTDKNPLAAVRYGKQEAQQPQTPDRSAEFERLIKGEYKDLYDAKVQDILKRRLRKSEEAAERYNAIAPTVALLARKYGMQPTADGKYDLAALQHAIETDDTTYAREAAERGIPVEQLRQMHRMERENATLKRQMEQEQTRQSAERLYRLWMEQAQQAKEIYPAFDLQKELRDPKFAGLLKSNVDMRTAYEVTHRDEILSGAMQFTAQKVEQQLANKLIARRSLPTENGNSAQSAALVKNDVSQLTKADRREIIRRVQRGEKIKF